MLYLLGALSVAIQIGCAVHAYRTGRDQIWIWVIMIGSMLGCTAYFAFEIMPELFGPGSRFARQQRDRVRPDVTTALGVAEDSVAKADTAANRAALGEAHMLAGAFKEAAFQFQTALDRMNGNDPVLETRLATALFEGGDATQALVVLGRIPEAGAIGEADRLGFLRARILAEMGHRDEAAALYSDIVTRLPGEEALCRYAALLLDMSRTAEARTVLETVEKRNAARKASPHDIEMLDWARQTLRGLRADG